MEAVWHTIVEVHAIVARAGQPFGYRTIAEMLQYVQQARGVLPAAQALDLQDQAEDSAQAARRGQPTFAARVGRSARADAGAAAPPRPTQVAPEQVDTAPFPDSAEKVRRMLERLDQEGFTDFYG